MSKFSVCGMGTELTKWQSINTGICKDLWVRFNRVLYKYGLHQLGAWEKYAFTYREDGKLYYFCSIPEQTILPKEFEIKRFPEQVYLVCKHIGTIDTIKDTVNEIYVKFLPSHNFLTQTNYFIHFEKYDIRYMKHSPESIIDIYIPVDRTIACHEIDLYDETHYL